MRIIAGTHRGRILLSPKGDHTRPTRGRIRESIFNIIQNKISGAAVLDLFAGSGAMGFEALSRGAKSAVFVDNARPARDALLKNIHSLQMTDQAGLLCMDYTNALHRLHCQMRRFDLLFVDPPYDFSNRIALFEQIRKSRVMNSDALLVYEHSPRCVFEPEGFGLIDARAYGETFVSFYKLASEA